MRPPTALELLDAFEEQLSLERPTYQYRRWVYDCRKRLLEQDYDELEAAVETATQNIDDVTLSLRTARESIST